MQEIVKQILYNFYVNPAVVNDDVIVHTEPVVGQSML